MIAGNFPNPILGDIIFFAAIYVSDRSPHSSLGDNTPCIKMHDKYTDMSALRSDEFEDVRAYTEACASKFGDKAWEGIPCSYSTYQWQSTPHLYALHA